MDNRLAIASILYLMVAGIYVHNIRNTIDDYMGPTYDTCIKIVVGLAAYMITTLYISYRFEATDVLTALVFAILTNTFALITLFHSIVFRFDPLDPEIIIFVVLTVGSIICSILAIYSGYKDDLERKRTADRDDAQDSDNFEPAVYVPE